jgi:HupE/UreJ protein
MITGRALLALLALLAPFAAHAHATSTSYLTAAATNRDGDVQLIWDVAVADVHWALGLDDDGDGRVTWREIESRRDDIAALASSHLTLARGARGCSQALADLLLTKHAGEPHVSLGFRARCEATGALAVSATLFFDKDATQRTLVDIATSAGQFTSILSPGTPRWIEPPAPSVLATFRTFVAQGLWHVWIGYDHLAFLILLLLPSVLRSVGDGWRQAGGFRETSADLLRIVTAFTVAHSITLGLAATGTVHVPARPVEITIAASIVIAGLLNLFPRAARARLGLAFGFGLVHGFGFANALAELGSQGSRLVPTLAGFNVGVELAQLTLVLILLPLLLKVRASSFYSARFLPAASLAAAMAGAAWLAARAG